MKSLCCSRRELIAGSGKAAIAGTAMLGGLYLPQRAWGAYGHGTVKILEGQAQSNKGALQVGSRVDFGEKVSVEKGSRLVLSMTDGSILRFTGPASMVLRLNNRREGIINMLLGAFLGVIPSGTRYLVGGPTGTIGIKGTVIYREIFSKGNVEVRTPRGIERTPADITDYLCVCHGTVDFYRNDSRENMVKNITAKHHTRFYLPRELSRPLLSPAPMLNHFDPEIEALINLQEGPRHDASWLKL